MNTQELHKIIKKFDAIFQHQVHQLYPISSSGSGYGSVNRFKQQRQILSHQIDDFLKIYSEKPPTPRSKLIEVSKLLSECNLPLTNYIFMQEANLAENERYFTSKNEFSHSLELSPSIAVTVISQKKKFRNIQTQFDTMTEQIEREKDKNQKQLQMMIKSLQMIRDDIQHIAEKYQKHKEKQKRIQYLLQRMAEYEIDFISD